MTNNDETAGDVIKQKHPWEEFLTARRKCMEWMRSERKNDRQIAHELSMDEEQVKRILWSFSDDTLSAPTAKPGLVGEAANLEIAWKAFYSVPCATVKDGLLSVVRALTKLSPSGTAGEKEITAPLNGGIRQAREPSDSFSLRSTSRESLPNSCESSDTGEEVV